MKIRLMSAFAAMVLAIVPAGAKELQKITITQAVASFSFLPLDYAKAAGYFAHEGYDVQQVATRGGGPDMAALLSGDVQFNTAAGTYQVSAIRQKRAVINVYNFYKRNLLDVVLRADVAKRLKVSHDMPLEQRLRALKGLKIGITRPGALTDKQIRHLMRLAGLQESDVKIVAIGGTTALLAANSRGQIDGFTISIPGARVAMERGEAVMLVNNSEGDDASTDPFMFQSLLTTKAYADAHPEVVKGIIRALKRAVRDIASKPAEDIRKVVQPIYAKVDPKTMILGIEAVKPALNLEGNVTMKMAEDTMRMDGAKDVTPQQLFATYTAAYQ